jgi:long-chain acyl-CoA synthetase
MSQTIAQIFWSQVERLGQSPAVWRMHQGSFQPLSWRQLADDVRRLALALRRYGVRPGDRVVQISENRYEWLVTDLAIQSLAAVHVPVHATLSGPQMVYQIDHCRPAVVMVSTDEQIDKVGAAAAGLREAGDFVVVAYDSARDEFAGRSIISWTSCLAAAGSDASFSPEPADPSAPATLLYTSGTTGEPKGVMLSQQNLTSNCQGVLQVLPVAHDDVRLCFLPLSHIFARTCDMYTWVVGGCQLALAQSRTTVIQDCAAVRPTIINGVPYFYERVCRAICDAGSAEDPQALQKLLGGRIRFCCSGGAALPDHVFDFFQQRGLAVCQGYGLTESSPVITVSTPDACRRGAVGRTIPDVEVRVADDGEILTRGPHVMLGYYRDPESTAQTIRDGWLHTGDLGRLDDDGYLHITGRRKEILVTLGGKNIAPVAIEALLAQDPLVHQALLLGDGKKYLAALIVPDPEALRSEIMRRKIPVVSPQQALIHPAVLELYAEVIRQRLMGVSQYEQVARFMLLPRAFSIELEEMTPKLSLRREVIQAHFAQEIAALFQENVDPSAAKSERCGTVPRRGV